MFHSFFFHESSLLFSSFLLSFPLVICLSCPLFLQSILAIINSVIGIEIYLNNLHSIHLHTIFSAINSFYYLIQLDCFLPEIHQASNYYSWHASFIQPTHLAILSSYHSCFMLTNLSTLYRSSYQSIFKSAIYLFFINSACLIINLLPFFFAMNSSSYQSNQSFNLAASYTSCHQSIMQLSILPSSLLATHRPIPFLSFFFFESLPFFSSDLTFCKVVKREPLNSKIFFSLSFF